MGRRHGSLRRRSIQRIEKLRLPSISIFLAPARLHRATQSVEFHRKYPLKTVMQRRSLKTLSHRAFWEWLDAAATDTNYSFFLLVLFERWRIFKECAYQNS